MKTTRIVAISVLVLVVGLPVGVANADFTFGEPTVLGEPIWSPGHDPQGCCFSRDGLELYFSSTRPGGYGFFDIWVATRETVDAPWGEPLNLGSNVNGSAGETDPSISPDGLELYFTFYHDYDIRVCSRPSKDAPWSNPKVLGPPVGVHDAYCPEVSADGLSLYFGSRRTGGQGDWDIWISNRATTSDPWSEPVNLGPIVNTGYYESYPSISSDGLALFFCSERPGGYGSGDIWVTTRPTTDAEWGPPINYPSLNQSFHDDNWSPAISPDGSVLYFETIFNLWQSSITPIVDLNGDGIVDAADMCIMVDYWGEDHSLCDIGPMPWGNGIVDVQDLIVLAEHLFTHPDAVVYWKLDETEGDVAYDSAAENDAVVSGNAAWAPDDGMIDGALQFDGIDDFIQAPRVLEPKDGVFSVFAWVKGGAPGQVVFSQEGVSDWLLVDRLNGCLESNLKVSGRSKKALISETPITDGHWHRVGLVWDGAYRSLYVDDELVARDTAHQGGLESSFGSFRAFNIGVGHDLDSGTFWSGMIDDVRIYSRAVSPQ
jgi:hypothetical protein